MDSSTHAHTPPKPKSSPGWMITIAAAAAFLATFNETFLNVAFAPIMSDLGVDVNTVQWLTTGYLLVAAVFVPVANVLYRRFPTRSLFIAVTAIMIVGSVIGALAPNFSTLLIGRLLQAIGTGLLTPIGMNITLAVSPRQKLGMNMGIMAAMTTLGPSLELGKTHWYWSRSMPHPPAGTHCRRWPLSCLGRPSSSAIGKYRPWQRTGRRRPRWQCMRWPAARTKCSSSAWRKLVALRLRPEKPLWAARCR